RSISIRCSAVTAGSWGRSTCSAMSPAAGSERRRTGTGWMWRAAGEVLPIHRDESLVSEMFEPLSLLDLVLVQELLHDVRGGLSGRSPHLLHHLGRWRRDVVRAQVADDVAVDLVVVNGRVQERRHHLR